MTSPVSIGDAFLMAKLAIKLGRAFTKGRKSAPAEFREVENQLYSLSAALAALDSAHKTAGSALTIDRTRLPSLSQQHQAEGGDVLKVMLQSCEETLKHVEAIVERYSSIGKAADSGAPVFKRWGRDVKDNWKKIEWTTEGGDLATLRSQLTVHTNSLNLVMGVISHTQTAHVEDQVDKVSIMLKEIHTWFVENLQDRPGSTPPAGVQRHDAAPAAETPLTEIRFEVYAESPDGLTLLCDTTSLHPKWNEKRSGTEGSEPAAQRQIFQCQCSDGNAATASHSGTLEAFGLSPLSFAMKLSGKERSWMIYKSANRSTGRLVSLVIKKVPASRIAKFEETFINTLGTSGAKLMLNRNISTMLAYAIPAGVDGAPEARVLNLMGDLQGIQKQFENVTFTVNRQSYTRSPIEAVQLLHYKKLSVGGLFAESGPYPDELAPLESAEVVIFFARENSDTTQTDIDRTILHLTHGTKIVHQAGEATVILKGIDCTGLGSDDKENVMASVDVSFQLSTPDAALKFWKRLEEMRMELFVLSLKTPRFDEKLVLRLQTRGVHTECVNIADSEVAIAQSETTEQFRLIITSRDGCTILSQELAGDFLNRPGGRPDFASPTYVVQIIDSGTRKTHLYKEGFKILEFSDVQMDRLVGLGLAAVSGGLHSSDKALPPST